MSKARTTFLERIATFRSVLDLEALVAKRLTDIEHNNKARLLRNGVTVVGYAVVEDFIRSRTGELVLKLSNGIVKFDDLPERLRRAATYDAVNALSFQADLLKKSSQDYIKYIQDQCKTISSTGTANFAIAPVAFAHDRSNVSADDIRDLIAAMGVKDPWGVIDRIAKRAGLGAAGKLQDLFSTAAKRRHHAAHRADHESASQDLVDFHRQALGIALGFDFVLSRAIRLIGDKNAGSVESLTESSFVLHFIDEDSSGVWRWHPEKAGVVYKKAKDEKNLLSLALDRARRQSCCIVMRGSDAIPRSWIIPEVS